jgi:hypothetical protein
MPYSGGTFTNVSGATTAAAGQTVQSAIWNAIHSDYATALTMVMSQLIATPSYRNILWMNGGMEVWQRGAGSSANIAQAASNNLYTLDRWYLSSGANQAMHVSAQTGLTNGSQLSARIQRDSGQTGTPQIIFGYPLDTDEIIAMRGKLISFTCAVQAGANWSPSSGTLIMNVYAGTGGSPARRVAGYAGESTILSISTNLTAGGAVTTISGSSSIVVPTGATQLEVSFLWTPTGTAGANDWFQIDDVQLEAQTSGSTWTPTNYDRIPFWHMYRACLGHYCKTFPYASAPVQAIGSNAGTIAVWSQANTRSGYWWQYPARMRSNTPDIVTYNPAVANANWRNNTSGADSAVTTNVNTTLSDQGVQIITATVSAADQSCLIHVTASAGIP